MEIIVGQRYRHVGSSDYEYEVIAGPDVNGKAAAWRVYLGEDDEDDERVLRLLSVKWLVEAPPKPVRVEALWWHDEAGLATLKGTPTTPWTKVGTLTRMSDGTTKFEVVE